MEEEWNIPEYVAVGIGEEGVSATAGEDYLVVERSEVPAVMVRWVAALAVALGSLSSAAGAEQQQHAEQQQQHAELRRLGAQELLRRAGLQQPAEMAQAEAELGAQAENAETLSPVVAETKAPPLGHSGTAEEEVSMDDVEKKLAQVGLPSDAISKAVDDAVDEGSIQDPEEMKPAERVAVAAEAADAVARDVTKSTPGGRAAKDPWLAFADSLQETGVGSKCTTTCSRNRRTKVNRCETVCEPHAPNPSSSAHVVPQARTAEVTPPKGVLKESDGTESENVGDSNGEEEEEEEEKVSGGDEKETETDTVESGGDQEEGAGVEQQRATQ